MIPPYRDAIAIVAKEFSVSVPEIMSRKRTRTIARARQAAYYVLRKRFALSYPEIGELFERDHGTIYAANKRVPALMQYDDMFRWCTTRALKRIMPGRRLLRFQGCSQDDPSTSCAGTGEDET